MDVASYALGVLGDAESVWFEEHLATCEACARQLEAFLPVVGLLPEVPIPTVDLPPRPVVLDGREGPASGPRRATRGATRRPPSVASRARAALRGRPSPHRPLRSLRSPSPRACSASSASSRHDEIVTATSAGAAPSAAVSPWNGLRGPDLEHGRRLEGTDPGTGVHAEVVLDAAAWGTKVSFALSRLPGPQNCRLVAVRRGGDERGRSPRGRPAARGTASRDSLTRWCCRPPPPWTGPTSSACASTRWGRAARGRW